MTVSRRQFVHGAGLAGLGLLAGCGRLPGQAQPAAPRIGYLASGSPTDPVYVQRAEALTQGLRDLGYTEGQNIQIDWRYGPRPRLPELAAELVHLPLSLIVAGTGNALRAILSSTSTLPIVVLFSGDLVRSGLVDSYARPSGNVTGLTYMASALAGKRLQLLHEAVPGLSRVAALWNTFEGPASEFELLQTQEAAAKLGIALQSVPVQEPGDLREAFRAMAREQTEGLITFAHAFSVDNRQQIVDLAAETRILAMYGLSEFAEAGGLIAYGPRLATLFRHAATYVHKILQGANPRDLPIEEPREFDLVINLKTVHSFGLTIPPHVLLQATEVIQ
jgi:putative ABC transport system substrate-binding protein